MVTNPATNTPAIRVLIAEDETHLGTILEQFLQARGMAVRVVRDGQTAIDTLRQESFDVALLDVVMPGLDGLEVLRLARELSSPPEILIVTGNGTIETAMAALTLGAYEVVTKPYKMAQIELLVRRAWEKRLLRRDVRRLRDRVEQLDPLADAPTGIDTQFAPLRAVLAMAQEVAATPMPIALIGEAGVGKRRVARTLHAWSARATAPFIELSPRGNGNMRDALIGTHERSGLLELVGTGTLYIPNLSEVPMDVQTLLWRVLDTGRMPGDGERAGDELPLRLMVSVAEGDTPRGAVYEPLWHRVQAVSITLPPLRERHVDIPLLTKRMLESAARRQGALTACRVTDEAVAALERQPWPGNLHELRQVLERATWRARDGQITAEMVTVGGDRGEQFAAPMALADVERTHIAAVLATTRWHQGRAAELLGISVKTLYRKIREYGFVRPRSGAGREVT